jgi:hypothetical protein
MDAGKNRHNIRMPLQTYLLGPSGGNGGSAPTAVPQPIPEDAAITGFLFASSTQVYQITIYYNSSSSGPGSLVFGAGSGGSTQKVPLNDGEAVTQVFGVYEDIVQTVGFKTSDNNTYGPYGSVGPTAGSGQAQYQYDIPPNTRFAGFWGLVSENDNINALGVILFGPAVE